jgi:hypothetical protein
LGWAFAAWGSALYLVSGIAYLVQVRTLVRDTPPWPAGVLSAHPHHDADRALDGRTR